MKLKFMKIIIIYMNIFLFRPVFILSQNSKNNIVREIATMNEIHDRILTDSEIINSDNVNNEEMKKNDEEKSFKISSETSLFENSEILEEREQRSDEPVNVEKTMPTDNIANSVPLKTQDSYNNSETFMPRKQKEDTDNKIAKNEKYEKNEQQKTKNKFEEINDRTNRVTALGSAMGAVDLGSTPEKKIRIGAGVGNSSSSQAVAVGVGYAPTSRFRISTKFSSSTDNINNKSISVGASYDLDL